MSRHLRRIERSRKASRVRTWDRYHREIRMSPHPEWTAYLTRAIAADDEAALNKALSVDFDWGSPEPATITNLDADHAAALEREAIAVWHETQSSLWKHSKNSPDDLARHECSHKEAQSMEVAHLISADAIRNGDHHANTPPNAQEQGWGTR